MYICVVIGIEPRSMLPPSYNPNLLHFSQAESHFFAQDRFKIVILLPWPLKQLGLQVCALQMVLSLLCNISSHSHTWGSSQALFALPQISLGQYLIWVTELFRPFLTPDPHLQSTHTCPIKAVAFTLCHSLKTQLSQLQENRYSQEDCACILHSA